MELDIRVRMSAGIADLRQDEIDGGKPGRLVGAVSVCGPVGRFDPDLFKSNVRRTARSIGDLID